MSLRSREWLGPSGVAKQRQQHHHSGPRFLGAKVSEPWPATCHSAAHLCRMGGSWFIPKVWALLDRP